MSQIPAAVTFPVVGVTAHHCAKSAVPRTRWSLTTHWARPSTTAPLSVIAGCCGLAFFAAISLWLTRIGIQVGLLGTGIAVILARMPGRAKPRDRWNLGFGALALALCWVPALRADLGMNLLALLGALWFAALAELRGRTWPGLLLTVPAAVLAGFRGLDWFGQAMRTLKPPTKWKIWLRAGGLTVTVGTVMAWLLSSADPAFSALLEKFIPSLDLSSLPGRSLIFAAFLMMFSSLTYSVVGQPRWESIQNRKKVLPTIEWALPVAIVAILLTGFIGVQFFQPQLSSTGAATRTRQGFGQLVVVTGLGIGLLAWAGRSSAQNGRPRRLLAGLGGLLAALIVLVDYSALMRLWQYEQAFGWTTLRLYVGAIELWLAVALLLSATLWLLRRTHLLPQIIATSAGLSLLGLAMAGPAGLVAHWNVDRYQRTGILDRAYLATLGADAAPAIHRLPESEHVQLKLWQTQQVPWYGQSLALWRAEQILGG